MKTSKLVAPLSIVLSAIPCYGHDAQGLAQAFTIFILLAIYIASFIIAFIISLFVYKQVKILIKVFYSFLIMFICPLVIYSIIFLFCYLFSNDNPTRTFIPSLAATPVIAILFGVLFFKQIKRRRDKSASYHQ